MTQALRLPAVLFTVLAAGCTALLVARFRRSLLQAELAAMQKRRDLALAVLLPLLWFVLAGMLARQGFFARPPHFPLALLGPVVVLTIICFRSTSVTEALRATPVSWLVYFQVFRIFVELLLWRGFTLGFVPVQMTFEGRNFDILAGLTAVLVGWLLHKYPNLWLGIAWNIAGLVLLVNVVSVALLSLPTPARHFMNGPSTALLASFPFIYLPAVLVPLAYFAHILSIRQFLIRRASI